MLNVGNQEAFRALADPSRRAILMHLTEDDLTIAEVSSRFEMTRGAVKKHLTILEEGGLISVRARGRERVNHLEAKALKPVFDWIGYFDRFWDTRLEKLSNAIEAHEERKQK